MALSEIEDWSKAEKVSGIHYIYKYLKIENILYFKSQLYSTITIIGNGIFIKYIQTLSSHKLLFSKK